MAPARVAAETRGQISAEALSTLMPRHGGLMAPGIDSARGDLDSVSKRRRLREGPNGAKAGARVAGRKNRLPRLFGVTACI